MRCLLLVGNLTGTHRSSMRTSIFAPLFWEPMRKSAMTPASTMSWATRFASV
jgi:hypothetical protein